MGFILHLSFLALVLLNLAHTEQSIRSMEHFDLSSNESATDTIIKPKSGQTP